MFSWLKPQHAVIIHPSTLLLTLLLLLSTYFVYQIRSILTLLFLAFIIMTALHPGVDKLTRKFRIPRPLSIFVVYLVAIGVIVGLLALIIPPLVTELFALVKTIQLPFLQEQLTTFKFSLSELSTFAQQLSSSVGVVFTIITSTFSSFITIFTLIVMSYYLMLDRPQLYKKIGWVTRDPAHLETAKRFLDDVERQLGGWVRGQLLLMLLIGFITYVGLLILGVPYAVPLALVAGLLEIVPNLGPTVAAIPAVIFGYVIGGPVMAVILTLFYIVIQQLENNIIVPRIMQQNADVNPLIAIVAIMTGLRLGGVMGALLAVPAYIVFRAFYSLLYHARQ